MKSILTIGCSFSALYYHPNPKYSYTYLLKEKLGFDKLINLSTGGLSPNGTFRLLSNYLQNPVAGKPDFIFIQYPSAYRCEVYPDESVIKDNISEDNWHLIGRTVFREGYDLLRDYEKGKRWSNPNWTDETFNLTKDDFKDVSIIAQEIRPFEDERNRGLYICPENVLKIFPSISEEFWNTFEKHDQGFDRDVYFKILADPRHATVNYSKYLGLIESLCEMYKIDYAYIDTDYSFLEANVELSQEIYDTFGKPDNPCSVMECVMNNSWGNMLTRWDENDIRIEHEYAKEGNHDNILDYCRGLFTGKNFIRGHSIGTLSPTHIDTYPDLHPGVESHKLFAENIASIIK